MFPNNLPFPQTKTIISAAVSAAATSMFISSVARDFFPHEFRGFLLSKLGAVLSSLSSQLTFVIQEFDGLTTNHLFRAAELYLEPAIAPNAQRLKLTMPKKEDKISISMEKNEEIVDTFNGIKIRWKLISKKIPGNYISNNDPYNPTIRSDLKCYELSFHKKHKEKVLTSYLNHVLQKSNELEEKKKTLKLFTMKNDRYHGGRAEMWQSVNLDHPSTFDTLALDFEIKKSIIEDLEKFVKRKEFYRKVGKAWKRGYLLYGPPGTGKSSLIAAMANYLNFDIYDLELTDLRANSDLRRLLVSTRNKSILVVEDIDCSIELQDRIAEAKAKNPRHFNGGFPGFNEGNSQVTLSGLLNFMDGLWSSCGDERIIVLTTNHKDKLDPALLRPGRMDLHIHMSYCTPTGFKMLASNYLQITAHSHFSAVEDLLQTTKVTPAEVGEQLMKNEVPDVALRALIEFLEEKKRKVDESETKLAESGEVGVEGIEEETARPGAD